LGYLLKKLEGGWKYRTLNGGPPKKKIFSWDPKKSSRPPVPVKIGPIPTQIFNQRIEERVPKTWGNIPPKWLVRIIRNLL